MGKKERIDVRLVQEGFFPSREQAKRSIMAGEVLVDDEVVLKPGQLVGIDQTIRLKGQTMRYVSRGGYKLEKALRTFQIDLTDAVVLDIGASTGGFTDCALQHGAKQVYAVDVGYNQLDWRLRSDPRVVVMERLNFRYATPDLFPLSPDVAMIDVSFISLRLILPPLYPILRSNGKVIALIKPQFEAGKERVGKKGVVRDPRVHEEVLLELLDFMTQQGYHVQGLTPSPIRGGEGNIEFLAYLIKAQDDQETLAPTIDVKKTVEEAHKLGKWVIICSFS